MSKDFSSIYRILVLILLALNTYFIADLWVGFKAAAAHKNQCALRTGSMKMPINEEKQFCPIVPMQMTPVSDASSHESK